jgi:anthranilate synthase component 1
MGDFGIQLAEIPFDFDLLDLHASDPARYPYLLESAAQAGHLGRYDILFAFPGQTLLLDARFELHGANGFAAPGFLTAFDNWWSELRGRPARRSDLPFTGGWFLMLGYELAQEIEPRLDLRRHPMLPVARATRIPAAVIRDRERSAAWIVAEQGYEACVKMILGDVETLPREGTGGGPLLVADSLVEEAPQQFISAVDAAKEYIAAGEIYQANLSREWTARLHQDVGPADVYRRLRRTNPAPFAGLAVFEDIAVISSSPERLLRTSEARIETRPIAGTRPRQAGAEADAPRREELLGHPKERAEHIMLIDLERNDLGRVCKPGTVQVDEFMVVETHAHVHHIVSNVSGELLDSATPGKMIRALFPGGSITGCPKVRCMEIISELENRARGFYTGTMGYINRDGGGDLNILIRTMTTIDRQLSFATGSGIVADSDPLQELDETRAKAKGLLLALAQNERRS